MKYKNLYSIWKIWIALLIMLQCLNLRWWRLFYLCMYLLQGQSYKPTYRMENCYRICERWIPTKKGVRRRKNIAPLIFTWAEGETELLVRFKTRFKLNTILRLSNTRFINVLIINLEHSRCYMSIIEGYPIISAEPKC